MSGRAYTHILLFFSNEIRHAFPAILLTTDQFSAVMRITCAAACVSSPATKGTPRPATVSGYSSPCASGAWVSSARPATETTTTGSAAAAHG